MPPAETEPCAPSDTLGAPCSACGIIVAPALLVCPRCHALVHRKELEQLAGTAEAAGARGDIADALVAWRSALALLPPETTQHERVTATIRALRERLDAGESPAASLTFAPANTEASGAARPTGVRRWLASLGSTLAFLALKLKGIWLLLLAGWKPLLLGLTKLGTLSTMLLSLGVYSSVIGWRLALGLVSCIYVHEIGHVVALTRLGIGASAPMFIPGLGAAVRSRQYPIDVDESAQVAIAGPRWGLAISAVMLVTALFTRSPVLKAIAHLSAYINLLNLIPIPVLDGGKAFGALANQQRLLCAVALGALYWFTREGFVGFIALAALFLAFESRPQATRNTRILIEYIGIATLLGLIVQRS